MILIFSLKCTRCSFDLLCQGQQVIWPCSSLLCCETGDWAVASSLHTTSSVSLSTSQFSSPCTIKSSLTLPQQLIALSSVFSKHMAHPSVAALVTLQWNCLLVSSLQTPLGQGLKAVPSSCLHLPQRSEYSMYSTNVY